MGGGACEEGDMEGVLGTWRCMVRAQRLPAADVTTTSGHVLSLSIFISEIGGFGGRGIPWPCGKIQQALGLNSTQDLAPN